MAPERRQQSVHDILSNSNGTQFLRRLTAELNYDFAGDGLPTRGWSASAREPLAEDPQLFATAAGGEFHVIYTRLKSERLLRAEERQVVGALLDDHPYALFVFSNRGQDRWHFVNVKHNVRHDKRRVLRRITVGSDERLRTASERISMLDVESLAPSPLGASPLELQKRHDEAFDVRPVTREFYRDYDRVFKRVEGMIEGFDEGSGDGQKARREKERKRLFTQRLFNRLMFIGFVQKKGWLKFGGSADYLAALWRDYVREVSGRKNFYRDRLKPLFFQGLSTPNDANTAGADRGGRLRALIGDVPYLNGGLFEEADDDRDANTSVPDGALDAIINDLFERYNFTVTESTPFDVEVAVDPEMLGKVFEELVTGRNESGSYYTPKPVVSFMCREALKGHLGGRYTPLVDEHETSDISVPEARRLLTRLADVRAVDLACGSGAYLLGLMHELHALVRLLDTRAEQESARDDYHRKLQIITNNMYGVDKDEFAVQIARLRLWLSLAVEYEGAEPEPLPNLDFKIECGDTLTAPGPEARGQFGLIEAVIREHQQKKAAYLRAHHGEKLALRGEVERLRQELRRARGDERASGFDWAIEFAEVFAPRGGTEPTPGGFGLANRPKQRQTPAEEAGARAGGFDIVLANPPYGASVDDRVRDLYFDRRAEGAQSKDTYGLFVARGLQLLAPGGQLCYIVSDTWRTIKSHRPLRKRLFEKTTVKHVLDLPAWIFDATVNTSILTLSKQPAPEGHQLTAGDLRSIPSGDWDSLTKNLLAVAGQGVDVQTTEYARYTYPQELIGGYDNYTFFIASPRMHALMTDGRFDKLGELASVKHGLTTGDTREYIYKEPSARGAYRVAGEVNKFDLGTDAPELTEDEKRHGLSEGRFGRRYLVPYDKGGASDSAEGWLPNYWAPTQYYIDWRRSAVDGMKTLPGFRHDGKDFYFLKGISFSHTGVYSPTFRLNSGGVFDTAGSCLFPHEFDVPALLGVLNSRLVRYLFKSYINHTVNAAEDPLKEIRICKLDAPQAERLAGLVSRIVEKQKAEPRYPYHLHEQKEIDLLVYELYGLSDEDIREVELWYCRRYPRLAEAQGALAEVRAKHGDHLARCARILEKPPAYWRSNPILTLAARGESHTLEYKEALETNLHTGARDPNSRLSTLKEIAAFLNTDGGVILLGVSDSSEVKGIGPDLRHLKPPSVGKFEEHLRSLIRDRFHPEPYGEITITFEDLPEGTVCRIDVAPTSDVTYVDNKIFIRDGNGSKELSAREFERWLSRRGGKKT